MISKLSSFEGVEISNDGDFLWIIQDHNGVEAGNVVKIPFDYIRMFEKALKKSIDDMDALNGVV
jgi:hypothetical protein